MAEAGSKKTDGTKVGLVLSLVVVAGVGGWQTYENLMLRKHTKTLLTNLAALPPNTLPANTIPTELQGLK